MTSSFTLVLHIILLGPELAMDSKTLEADAELSKAGAFSLPR